MDGRGRVFDNIFVERFRRSVKYERVYLTGYQTIPETESGLERYIRLYNEDRSHQKRGYETPAEIYFQKATGENLADCSHTQNPP